VYGTCPMPSRGDHRVFKEPDVYGTAAMRVFFEFSLPLLVGGYTIYSMLARSLT
jgi:hypothetical protein